MIIFDFETTGLLKPEVAELKEQPKAIEIAALKINKDLEFVDQFSALINPEIPIPDFITKITGINDEMIKNGPTFIEVYDQLYDMFLGEDTWIAHNVMFDVGVMKYELMRIGKEFNFPWPKQLICTIEKTMHFKGRRLKLGLLHEMVVGKPYSEGAHRAMNDVYALTRVFCGLIRNGDLEI